MAEREGQSAGRVCHLLAVFVASAAITIYALVKAATDRPEAGEEVA
ncbi:MAG: hypothetical protein V1750_07270 [Acidobacteriota bacterium]